MSRAGASGGSAGSARRVRTPVVAGVASAAVALATVGIATALTLMLWPYAHHAPFTLYYLAVVVASVHGGAFAGALGLVTSVAVVGGAILPRFEASVPKEKVVSLVLFVGVAGVVVGLVHRMRASEGAVHTREARLAGLIRSALNAIVMVDGGQRVVLFNPAAEAMFRCPAASALGQPLARFLAEPDIAPPPRPGQAVGSAMAARTDLNVVRSLEARRADGVAFPVEAAVSHSDSSGQPLLTFILDDVSERRAQEREIRRLNRLYQALRHVNQAIVRTRVREDLFDRVCEILVEHGGFRMTWIGWHDPDQHLLVPVAQAGEAQGYLERVPSYTDDRPAARGPAGAAFREGVPYICNDLANDPATLAWREETDRRGYRACAVLPIRVSGEVRGTLNVYSDQPGFFQDKEIALLTEAAIDLSIALDHLVGAAERERIEAVAERERRFANTLIESMPGIFYFYDDRGRFLRWNRNFASVSGRSDEEILGMHPLDFFAADERQVVEQRIAEVFERGESQVEASFLAKDGTATPYYFTGNRVIFDGATCLVGVGVDLSERRRAELALSRSEERYRTTLDHMLESCQIIGFDWKYLYLNDAAAQQNRRPNQELLGQRMPEMWPGIEAMPVFAMLATCMAERRPLHQETEFTFPDGATGWFDVRAQPVPEGVFVLSIDISERKQAERELRDLNDSLELKVAERTRDLEIARGRAEAADRLKSAFLATMSHELRTPLNSIIGFTGILVQGLAGPLNAEQAKQLGMVQSSARHLLELINDVLDISKIEAGQVEVRLGRFDLQASIDRVVASIRPEAERKHLAVQVTAPPALVELRSDQRRVDQILLNLLNNAVKFTDRGSVTLTAELVDDVAAGGAGTPRPAARIRVADTGIGIKPEDLAKLFVPFRQIDSGLERQHEGTGLGLAICRRLTQLLGGTIAAESAWGQGSVFTVTLPLEPRT
jgi:PAS domain S-box-containing protein